MGAEPGMPNELSPITRIDTARVRRVQSAAGRSFIEPGSPWQNPFAVVRLPRPRRGAPGRGIRLRARGANGQSSLTGELSATTGGHSGLGWRLPAAYAASLTTNKSDNRPDSYSGRTDERGRQAEEAARPLNTTTRNAAVERVTRIELR